MLTPPHHHHNARASPVHLSSCVSRCLFLTLVTEQDLLVATLVEQAQAARAEAGHARKATQQLQQLVDRQGTTIQSLKMIVRLRDATIADHRSRQPLSELDNARRVRHGVGLIRGTVERPGPIRLGCAGDKAGRARGLTATSRVDVLGGP